MNTPRTFVNRPGIVFDPTKTQIFYAEDINESNENITEIANSFFISNIKTVTVNISADQIKGMYASPIPVVSGVAGKILIPIMATFNFTVGNTQYQGGGNSQIKEETSLENLCVINASQTFLNGATSFITSMLCNTAVIKRVVGKGMVYSNINAAFTTGNGTAVLKVVYCEFTP